MNGTSPPSSFGLKLLDRLRDEGRISAVVYESIANRVRRSGEPVPELIIDSGAMGEVDLLKAIANHYQTRFVSTERLAKAGIDRATLTMVPRRVCERYQCCPVVFDPRAQSLAIVVADLEEDIAKQVQVVASVREVKAYVARPKAIAAAIRKYYGGDPTAFADLLTAETKPASEEPDSPVPSKRQRTITGAAMLEPPTRPAAPPRPPRGVPAPIEIADFRLDAPTPDGNALLEMTKALVTLLDQGRGELAGHSAHVAAMCRRLGEALGLTAGEVNAIALAGCLHDIGKTASNYHLTLLNVSRFEGHRTQAEKTVRTPSTALASAALPEATTRALDSMYERWDGQGFPKQLAAAQIPMGARIVALVDTFADLTTNPKNPYRRVLAPREAIDVVRQLGGKLFDPSLVEPLRGLVVGDRPTGMPEARGRVLLVDPDSAHRASLEQRFRERGYAVAQASTRPEAEGRLRGEKFDVVVLEVTLDGGDGIGLVSSMRADPRHESTVFVFVTGRGDSDHVASGLASGAVDYITKPVAPEVVVAKVLQHQEAPRDRGRVQGGIAGSVKDMALADVIQVLGQGRKSGCLRVTGNKVGGEIYFNEGLVVHATSAGERGEAAFYALATVKEGEFRFVPDAAPKERSIQAPTESLLLEAMRRLDEGL